MNYSKAKWYNVLVDSADTLKEFVILRKEHLRIFPKLRKYIIYLRKYKIYLTVPDITFNFI
jgi:hypothetical protein